MHSWPLMSMRCYLAELPKLRLRQHQLVPGRSRFDPLRQPFHSRAQVQAAQVPGDCTDGLPGDGSLRARASGNRVDCGQAQVELRGERVEGGLVGGAEAVAQCGRPGRALFIGMRRAEIEDDAGAMAKTPALAR